MRSVYIPTQDILSGRFPDPLGESAMSLSAWDDVIDAGLRLDANAVIAGTFPLPDERQFKSAV